MPATRCFRIGCIAAVTVWGGASASGGSLQVVSMDPPRHALTAPVNTNVTLDFDRPLDTASITTSSVRVFGRWSGARVQSFAFSNGNQTLTITPDRAFSAGEIVFVNLSHDVRGADTTALGIGGFAYQFWTRTQPSTRVFTEIAVMSNRTTPGAQTRIYGALGSDVNGDGYLDLTTVNEVSADLRVFLNLADGSGLYSPFLQPPFPIGFESSPNEPGDFDNNGTVDVAIAASSEDSAWIVKGNGDGTFASSQEIPVSDSPHGLTVLDVDGDADWDVVTTSSVGDNVSLMLNNGSGTFGSASFFEGGGTGEYGLSSGDMDNDGVMDLVVGAIDSQLVIIHHGNGDGTFTPVFTQSAGGAVWMIVCGDVNGDGNLDVATANSGSHNGAILLGNGDGTLDPPVTMPTAVHVVATDLGDMDGDGDLDWMLSSFGGGQWRLFVNNGLGGFAFDQQFDAPSNPSCAVMLDFDNDGDLDLALTDEIADVVTLMRNENDQGPVPTVSTWGALVMSLLLLTLGTIILRTRVAPVFNR